MNEKIMQQGSLESVVQDRSTPFDGAIGNWTDVDRAVRAFVAERPFTAVGLAMGAGYLIGRAISSAR